jgi:hypothetical protein
MMSAYIERRMIPNDHVIVLKEEILSPNSKPATPSQWKLKTFLAFVVSCIIIALTIALDNKSTSQVARPAADIEEVTASLNPIMASSTTQPPLPETILAAAPSTTTNTVAPAPTQFLMQESQKFSKFYGYDFRDSLYQVPQMKVVNYYHGPGKGGIYDFQATSKNVYMSKQGLNLLVSSVSQGIPSRLTTQALPSKLLRLNLIGFNTEL